VTRPLLRKQGKLAFVLIVGLSATLLSADRAGATTWDEFRHDHYKALHRGLVNPGLPGKGITADWLMARAEYVTEIRRRTDRLFHRWQDVRAAELAAVVVPAGVGSGGGTFSGSPDWEAIADCEWNAASWTQAVTTGNGYYFRLQFAEGTWNAYRGSLEPIDYWVGIDTAPTESQQIGVAEAVLAAQGPGAWPNCFQWQ
jgi:hypothetical protein